MRWRTSSACPVSLSVVLCLALAPSCDGNGSPPAGGLGGLRTAGAGGAAGAPGAGGAAGAPGAGGRTGTGLFGGPRPGQGGMGGTAGGGAGGTGGDAFAMCLAQHCARETEQCGRTMSCPAFLSCFLECETQACANGCFDRFGNAAAAAGLAYLQCALDFCFESDGPPNCRNTCLYSGDRECDDGGPGAVTGLCRPGTDCTDCGPR